MATLAFCTARRQTTPTAARKKSIMVHPAKTVPGRNQISQRPAEANNRTEIRHFEMDTIVSGV